MSGAALRMSSHTGWELTRMALAQEVNAIFMKLPDGGWTRRSKGHGTTSISAQYWVTADLAKPMGSLNNRTFLPSGTTPRMARAL